MKQGSNYKLYNSSKEDVLSLNSLNFIITDNDFDRRYAILEVNNIKYGVAWNSETMDPEVLFVEKYNIVVIGIDQKVVGISTINNNIVLSIGTFDYFSMFMEMDLGFAIITESGIIAINGYNCSISQFTGSPNADILTDIKIIEGKFHIKTLDGSSFVV